jgi:hypothetical protein
MWGANAASAGLVLVDQNSSSTVLRDLSISGCSHETDTLAADEGEINIYSVGGHLTNLYLDSQKKRMEAGGFVQIDAGVYALAHQVGQAPARGPFIERHQAPPS